MGSPKFRFVCDHIINTLHTTLSKSAPEQQSKILLSLLKKLQANDNGAAMDTSVLPKILNLNTSQNSLLADDYKVQDPLEKRKDRKPSLGSKVKSHETLL